VPTIHAIVPTYRPDADGLLALLDDLQACDVPVLVSDDASPATADRLLARVAARGIDVIRHRYNAGIARGLNEGLARAGQHGCAYLLTLDQDTRLPDGVVASLLQVAQASPQAGVVGVEVIRDASSDLSYPSKSVGGLLVTEEVFQTASLWRVDALRAGGGFDERLGIDGVDAAACLRLRERGWLVALAPGTHVLHRYGAGSEVRLLGRSIVSTGHSPARRESMVRNRLALAPAEFRQSPAHALRTIRRVAMNTVLGATIEEHRIANLMGSLRGLASPRR